MAASQTLSSFRDPSGTLFSVQERILRRVSAEAAEEARRFLKSPTARDLIASGQLIGTREVTDTEVLRHLEGWHRSVVDSFGESGCLLEHERVGFPSYAYEWPPEMLYEAGMLTLDIAEASLRADFGLKDATPYNVLYRGPKPVFIDFLSFERREPADATWLAYGQFVRMFLLPLLMQKEFGMGLDQLFATRADGLEPEEVYQHCTWLARLKRPFLTEVSIPTWLKSRHNPDDRAIYRKTLQSNAEKAKFILGMQFRHLRKVLRRAAPSTKRESTWAPYMSTLSYSGDDFQRKQDFVLKAVAEFKPKSVLDIGCNTGHFSAIAAKGGASVVGIDLDPVVVGSTFRRAVADQLDILPLVVNLARPTPSTGWRNAEYRSFLSRATGAFDMVMMLAALHHLLVTERIPLHEIVNLTSELTTGLALIEYVAKEDPMFQRLTRGREALHADFTREAFEAACRQRFTILRQEAVKGDLRRLYLLRKLGS